jgi:hypothetical protein
VAQRFVVEKAFSLLLVAHMQRPFLARPSGVNLRTVLSRSRVDTMISGNNLPRAGVKHSHLAMHCNGIVAAHE